MIPLTVGFLGGTERIGLKRAFFFSLVFVVGLSITFTIMGVIAAYMGRLFGDVGGFWRYVVFTVCVIMGLHLLGLLRFRIPAPSSFNPKRGGAFGGLLLGLLFGVVSAPCATPILAVLLTLVASKGNLAYGGGLLFSYALGHSALILVAGTSMGAAKTILESKGIRGGMTLMKKVAAVVIILVGIYFLLYSQ
jgi:cytochrome c biogenesis protein CcdA